MKYLYLILIALPNLLWSNVSSTKEQIDFDVLHDNQIEMSLNQMGLGLGKTPNMTLDIQGNAQVSSNLHLGGTLHLSYQTILSDTTLGSNTLVLLDTSSDNLVINLPPASQANGRVYKLKRISLSNDCYITSSDTIDGNSRLYLHNPPNELAYVELVSNGSQWHSLSKVTQVKSITSSDNLVAWWKLDELPGSTRVIDSSGNQYHGTYTNIGSDNIGNIGKHYRGTLFTDSDDRILIDSNSDLELDHFTYSFWINFEVVGSQEVLLVHKTNILTSFGAILMRKETSDAITAFLHDGTDYEPRVTSSISIEANQWHHVVLTFYQNDLTLYIDGHAASTSRNFSVAYATTNQLVIGNNGSGTQSAGAVMDDFRVYNYAMSSSEVVDLHFSQP